MKTDIVFENLKVGQEVYSLNWGECVLSVIDNSSYPIIVTFENGNTRCFSTEGYYYNSDTNPTLFLTNPFEKLNQERVIEVKSINGKYIPRVCIKVVDGRALCYCDAETLEQAKNATYTQVIGVGQWRELQPEQPAAEQPKEITIDGVEYVLTPKTK